MAVDDGPVQGPAAPYDQAVVGLGDVGAHGVQIVGHDADAVGLLDL